MNKRNLGGLYVVQIANTLLPLLTVPYLARTLGVEGFGLLSWTVAATFLVVLACDSAINGTAIRALAHRQHSPTSVQRIFTATQVIRAVLALIGSCLLWALLAAFNAWNGSPFLLALAMLNVLGTLSFPTYYFLAAEQSQYTAIHHLLGRGLAVILVFILVRSPDDVAMAIALQSSATLASGIVAHLVRGKHSLPSYGRFSRRLARVLVKRARPSYVPEIQMQAMGSVPVIVLGVVSGTAEAGIYALCDKLARAGYSMFQPILQAKLPGWARRYKAGEPLPLSLARVPELIKLGAAALCAAIVMFVGAPLWIRLIAGSKFADSPHVSSVLQILAVWMASHVVVRSMELRAYVAAGRARHFWFAMRWGLLLQWALLVPCSLLWGSLGSASAIALCEVLFVWRVSKSLSVL